MSDVTVKSKKETHLGESIHFSIGENHYVASDNGTETVIFKANEKGEVIDWSGIYDAWTFNVIKNLFEN